MEHSPRESIYRDELSNYQRYKDQYTKEILVSKLLLYLDKNSIERDLLEDSIYLEHVALNTLRKQYLSLLKSKINNIVSKKERIDVYDHYSCYRPYRTGNWFIDRNKPHANKWVNLNMLSNDINTERTIRSNYWSIKDLIWVLFIKHNRLFVLRMDFYLPLENKNNLDKLNHDFNRLLVNYLYKEDWYLKYYAVREYSESDGIHLHCLLFLDTHVYQNSSGLYNTIKEKWLRIGGKSVYNREYQNTLPDRNSVLGVIHYHQLDKIKLSKNESFKELIDSNEYVLENQYWLD